MVDFHTHVLSGMDDGSKSVSQSCRMLKRLTEQGAGIAAVTPHYYSNLESIPQFLNRRGAQYELLRNGCREVQGLPDLILGAEVAFYQSMSRDVNLDRLCFEDTRLLLLEMPFVPWSARILKEVYSLVANHGITPVIAHLDRYFDSQPVEELLKMDIPIQINASALGAFHTRKTVIRLLRQGRPLLLGSDCHNMDDRAPVLGAACEIIRRKFGENTLDKMEHYALGLLGRERHSDR